MGGRASPPLTRQPSYDYVCGDSFRVECPTGSGQMRTLWETAQELARRFVSIFDRDPATGCRPLHGSEVMLSSDPHFKDLVLFHEYFHAETGQGLGASHQTGWTALVAKLILQLGKGAKHYHGMADYTPR